MNAPSLAKRVAELRKVYPLPVPLSALIMYAQREAESATPVNIVSRGAW